MLRVYSDLEQGSPEWLSARCGIVTASTIGQLITAKTIKPAANDYSRALTATLVAERITGRVDPVFPNRDMQRGTMLEPFARDAYAEHLGVTVAEVGFMLSETPDYKLGFSPDGLVGTGGLIEIKSPRAKAHIQTVIDDEVPLQYVPQIQTGLLVSGRAWADFISYCPGLPLYIKRVTPDERWAEAIKQAAISTEAAIQSAVTAFAQASNGRPHTEWFDPFEEPEFTF